MQSILIEFPNLGRFTREWLEEHEPEAQALMSKCKGSRYPRCLCREPGLPLYIAQRNRYYLARMPETGPLHASRCPSYEPDRTLCGLGVYSPEAMEDHGDGHLTVKLGVPLLIRDTGQGGAMANASQGTLEHPYRDKLTLRGLLHLLWERAKFNRWRPGMQNRRHYRQIYKFLLEAAELITVRRRPLTRHLYMPEPFVSAQALEIEARRQKAFRERSQTANRIPLRILVCGQLRSILESQTEPGLRLAHLPNELVIRVAPDTLAKIRQSSEFAWVDWPALHPEFRLILLFTMQRAHQGRWTIDELACMAVTEDFIPVFSMEEALVAKHLINESRYFYKPLPYDAAHITFPNFLLTDCGDKPVPLEIATRTADASARHARVAEYIDEHRPHWLWDTHAAAQPPPLLQPSST